MRARLLTLTAAIPTLLLAGCGKEVQPPPPPVPMPSTTKEAPKPAPATDAKAAPAAEGSIATAELDKVTKAAKPYKIALIVKTRNNPFFTPMIQAAEQEAKALGATLEVQAPAQENDKEQQFALVQNVVAKGVDAILVAPADSKGIVPALKAAQDKGVLVINLDNRVDADAAKTGGLTLAGYVGADNETGGKLAGETLLKALGGKGKVAVLEGIRGADNAEARKRGFEAAAKGGLEVVANESAEWDTQKAYTKTVSILAAHPDIVGLFCANDKMAVGAMKAISEAGKKGTIKVVGYDNIPDVKGPLGDGQMLATIEQHPDFMGKYGVKMAVGILDGSVAKGKESLVALEVIAGK